MRKEILTYSASWNQDSREKRLNTKSNHANSEPEHCLLDRSKSLGVHRPFILLLGNATEINLKVRYYRRN